MNVQQRGATGWSRGGKSENAEGFDSNTRPSTTMSTRLAARALWDARQDLSASSRSSATEFMQ